MTAQVISAMLGIWLMSAPAVLGYKDPAASNDHITGPIIATFAIVSWWEATRSVRLANIVTGAWLLLGPWIFGFETAAAINDSLVGAAVIILSLFKGTTQQQFGGGWRSLFHN